MSTNTKSEIEEILRTFPAVLAAIDREFLKSCLNSEELTTEQADRINAIAHELLLPPVVTSI